MLEESTARNLEQQIQLGKTKVLGSHKKVISSGSVFVKDNRIISGSWDKTIKIWDINTGECLKTLEGHTDNVNSVFVKDNLIISSSNDKTIKIWDINTGDCINTLKGHTSAVYSAVSVLDNLIISSSEDKTIRIWDINTGDCLKTLTDDTHCPNSNSVLAKDNLIISGSVSGTIRITPISLFPGELSVFQSVMDSYNLAHHLVREIHDYFAGK